MPFCCFWSLLVLFLHVLTMVLLMQLLLVLGFLLLFCFLLIRPRVGLFVWRETDERLRKKSTIWEASEWRAPSWCFWWNAWRYCLDTVWIVCILILVHFTFFFSTQSSKKTRSILEAAYADNGLALDYYRGFDADWNEPAWPVQVFDVLWSLNLHASAVSWRIAGL